ncbi:hypothetical protein N431DRAFT_500648 [Stipitochalara longipes BDJ]|nr:hypothetical protein N431DRAFT_500648 [Stipitochalara longipes BDJ]
MQPITEDQEWTLRRWASTVGKRPRKKDMLFLKAEKGLSEAQIDSWWKNIDSVKSEGTVQTTMDMSQNSFQQEESTANEASQAVQQMNGLQFGLPTQDFSFFLPPSQETQVWSPIGVTHDNFSSSLPSMLDVPKSTFWSSTMGAERPPSDFSESSPLLSQSICHRRCMTDGTYDADRSSYSSSLRTWDTASTLVSFCDVYTEDIKPTDLHESDSSFNPSQLQVIRRPPPLSSFAPQKTIPEEEVCLNRVSLSRAHERIQLPSNFKFPSEPEAPINSQKGQEKYRCTSCKRGFNRKGDWKRHEESHDPQTYWTCLLGDPAKLSATGWTCVFCGSFKTARADMATHLLHKHKIHLCTNKKVEARTFYRKDKLKQHLQQVHALSENCPALWETWHQTTKKKWAWGCGFCGGCSFTWEGRLIHIAEHYEKQNLGTARWSHSLVVKGLLKQFFPGFNVAQAWKELVSRDANGDRLLAWHRKDAIRLKTMLEFHEGAAADIAAEAQQLAMNRTPIHNNLAWSPSDSRVPTLTSPIMVEFGMHTWAEESGESVSTTAVFGYQPDVEMKDNGPYI